MGNRTDLSIIRDGTSIVNNVAATISQLGDFKSTKEVRHAANKFIYSVKTLGTARHLVNTLDFEEEDYSRLNSLFNAFTYRATEDILGG